MKIKTLFMLGLAAALTLTAALALAAALPAMAAGAEVPFKAFYVTYPVAYYDPASGCNIQTIPGEGKGAHLGESTLFSNATACRRPTGLEQQGTLEFTADDGSQLIGWFKGGGAILPDGRVNFSGDFWIESGNGRFEGATGSGKYEGTILLPPGGGVCAPGACTGSIVFEGTLIK